MRRWRAVLAAKGYSRYYILYRAQHLLEPGEPLVIRYKFAKDVELDFKKESSTYRIASKTLKLAKTIHIKRV